MTRLLIAAILGCATPTVSLVQAQVATVTDTVIRFNVASRTWTWPYLLAHVGTSCRGSEVVVGTTTAPDTAAKDRDRYCAGAVIEMRNSTLTLRGARGLVHVRFNRAPKDSTRQPRR